MHSRSKNIEFTSYSNANEVVDELFKSFRNLETSVKRSGFIFDSVQIVYYKCHKENFGRGGSEKKKNQLEILKIQMINVFNMHNCSIKL